MCVCVLAGLPFSRSHAHLPSMPHSFNDESKHRPSAAAGLLFFSLSARLLLASAAQDEVMWLCVVHSFPWRRQIVPVTLQTAPPLPPPPLSFCWALICMSATSQRDNLTRPRLSEQPSVGSAPWNLLVRQCPSRRQAGNSGLKVLLSQIFWSLGAHLSHEDASKIWKP